MQRPVFHPHPNPLPSRDPCVIVVPAKSLPRTRYGGDPCKSVIPAKAGIQARLNKGATLQRPVFHPHPNPLPSRDPCVIAVPAKGDPCKSVIPAKAESRPGTEEPQRPVFHPHPNPLPSRDPCVIVMQIRHSGESRNPGGGGPAWIASFRSPMLLCSESYAKVSEGGNPGLRWSASTMLIHCHDFTLSP